MSGSDRKSLVQRLKHGVRFTFGRFNRRESKNGVRFNHILRMPPPRALVVCRVDRPKA